MVLIERLVAYWATTHLSRRRRSPSLKKETTRTLPTSKETRPREDLHILTVLQLPQGHRGQHDSRHWGQDAQITLQEGQHLLWCQGSQRLLRRQERVGDSQRLRARIWAYSKDVRLSVASPGFSCWLWIVNQPAWNMGEMERQFEQSKASVGVQSRAAQMYQNYIVYWNSENYMFSSISSHSRVEQQNVHD